MNWLDAAESIVTSGPPRRSGALRENGSWSESTSTPSWRNPLRTGPIGRREAGSSPTNWVDPGTKAATTGRNLMTVPANPHSIGPAGRARRGTTRTEDGPTDWMSAPRRCRPADIRRESREVKTPSRMLGPSPRAARTRARFVWDFDPGTTTRPARRWWARGAVHKCWSVSNLLLSLLGLFLGLLLRSSGFLLCLLQLLTS